MVLLSVKPPMALSLERALIEADAGNWTESGITPDEIAMIDAHGLALAKPYRKPGVWT